MQAPDTYGTPFDVQQLYFELGAPLGQPSHQQVQKLGIGKRAKTSSKSQEKNDHPRRPHTIRPVSPLPKDPKYRRKSLGDGQAASEAPHHHRPPTTEKGVPFGRPGKAPRSGVPRDSWRRSRTPTEPLFNSLKESAQSIVFPAPATSPSQPHEKWKNGKK